ncbi:FixH family protein [Parerythrobacter jejuensis]|uniref:Nitrogen fixation protein FixH n=1 Tax=Parerythrobacter jejuensis TaxID=795812 RepID=A0A845AK42_9SPHN|nr:FixH family protein [Parerythrobacter jejuensis]MXP30630.1 hypothetical protein [Parerythrobacter jejuensis]MXP33390.1 hypothetical protein [Parerythrobacter jejuensis]
MKREFTGRHMLAVLVVGFGIVVAVNFYMASLATRGFSGVVVQNSYIASQQFNGWLEEARRQEALGWQGVIGRDGNGRLEVAAQAIPAGAVVSADLRRPLGEPDDRQITLVPAGEGRFVTPEPLPTGRWIVRITVEAEGEAVRFQDEMT